MAKEEKNNQEKEFKGKNLDEVISNAEHVLKLPRNKINYEVVTEKTRLFGIKTKETHPEAAFFFAVARTRAL